MLFEYDPANSATNKAKHGIDFDEAQVLWKDCLDAGSSGNNR